MLNKALRILRIFHDIKSFEMANQLNISPSYLSEIENGKKEPKLSLIQKYAKIFHTKPSSILLFSEDIGNIKNKKKQKEIIRKKTIDFLQNIKNPKA